MKISLFLTIAFFLFFVQTITSQSDIKIDSLLKVYESQSLSIEKVKTADALFNNLKRVKPKLALRYLHESLIISKKIQYFEGEGKTLQNLGRYYGKFRNLDSLRYYFEKAEDIQRTLENKKGLFSTLHAWTRLENLEGNFERAMALSDKSIELAKELNNGLMLSDAFQRKSTIYLDKGNYKLAIENLLNASRVLDTIEPQNPVKHAIVIVGIGRTELLRDNYRESLKPLYDGLKIFKQHNEDRWQAITYIEIGSAYYHLKEYDNSLENYNNSLDISYKMKIDDFIAANLGNIGAIYLEKKEYDKALKYFYESNSIAEKRESINNQIININDIASAYLGKKDYNNAIKNYTLAIQLADSIGSIDILSDAYKERAETYEKTGAFKNAFNDHKVYLKLKDSVFNITKSKQIEELKTQYNTEKKEQQIVLQEKEIDLLEQKAKISNLQRILLGIGLLLSLIGFYAIRQKLKRNKLEKEKLDVELNFKKKELTTHALHLAKKNEVLEGLKQKAEELKTSDNGQNGYQQLIRTINFDLQDDNNWQNFSKYFQQVHTNFNSNVKKKFPKVTSNELRLMSLLKMNLSSKEIANILNISQEGIKKARYRLRKKLEITSENSLQDLVLSL
jgi:tetratricopeptide (TPR) repeat protein